MAKQVTDVVQEIYALNEWAGGKSIVGTMIPAKLSRAEGRFRRSNAQSEEEFVSRVEQFYNDVLLEFAKRQSAPGAEIRHVGVITSIFVLNVLTALQKGEDPVWVIKQRVPPHNHLPYEFENGSITEWAVKDGKFEVPIVYGATYPEFERAGSQRIDSMMDVRMTEYYVSKGIPEIRVDKPIKGMLVVLKYAQTKYENYLGPLNQASVVSGNGASR